MFWSSTSIARFIHWVYLYLIKAVNTQNWCTFALDIITTIKPSIFYCKVHHVKYLNKFVDKLVKYGILTCISQSQKWHIKTTRYIFQWSSSHNIEWQAISNCTDYYQYWSDDNVNPSDYFLPRPFNFVLGNSRCIYLYCGIWEFEWMN